MRRYIMSLRNLIRSVMQNKLTFIVNVLWFLVDKNRLSTHFHHWYHTDALDETSIKYNQFIGLTSNSKMFLKAIVFFAFVAVASAGKSILMIYITYLICKHTPNKSSNNQFNKWALKQYIRNFFGLLNNFKFIKQ